ncbi:MAG TPA: hypothetical protein VF171_02370 [Trueperaceae bacterium]
MESPVFPSRLVWLGELGPTHPAWEHAEVRALAALAAAGLPLAPLRLVPAAAEERFYRLNNLPERLVALFEGVNLSDPDEDDIEELAPEAQTLIVSHYLLDEFIDVFYEGLASMPAAVRLRRPGQQAGRTAPRGRPALLALKKLWADAWSLEALMARLTANAGIALPAEPVLVGAPGLEAAPAELERHAAEILGAPVRLRVEPASGITGVMLKHQG